MMPIVHIAETKDFSKEALLQLRSFATVIDDPVDNSSLTLALQNCDVFWFRLAFRITAEHLSARTRCKFIVCPVTGLDHIDLDACAKANISVISLKGEVEFLRNVRATAELTIGLTLALLRRIPEAVNETKRGLWVRGNFKGTEILNKKVGVLGVGRLGTIVAGYFKTFGADVFGYDIKSFDASVCKPLASIEELAATVDILSIHVSYSPATHHLVSQRILNQMRPSAVLINTARGGVVDSEALVNALKTKQLAGAALDVVEDEHHVNAKHALIEYSAMNPNLIITPHIGGNTYESFAKTELFMVSKLKYALDARA